MKKILSFFIAVLALLTLYGCVKDEPKVLSAPTNVAISEEGYIQGPSQVGSYQLVVQLLEKGETEMEWVDKAILTTFSILES